MSKICFQQFAPDGSVFAPGCFESQIGKVIPFTAGDITYDGKILDVEDSVNGSHVVITMEIPSEAFPAAIHGLGIEGLGIEGLNS